MFLHGQKNYANFYQKKKKINKIKANSKKTESDKSHLCNLNFSLFLSLSYDTAFHMSITFPTSTLRHPICRREGGHLLLYFNPAQCATIVLNIDLKKKPSSKDIMIKCHQFNDVHYCNANLTNINSIFTIPQMTYQ